MLPRLKAVSCHTGRRPVKCDLYSAMDERALVAVGTDGCSYCRVNLRFMKIE
jgi:hypothetical protein